MNGSGESNNSVPWTNAFERKTYAILSRLFPGLPVRGQAGDLPGTPDFVIDFDGFIFCVFCDGDFWHKGRGMRSHALKKLAAGDEEKSLFWLEKAASNKERDRKANRDLKKMGVPFVRLSERGIEGKDPEGYVSRSIAYALHPFLGERRTERKKSTKKHQADLIEEVSAPEKNEETALPVEKQRKKPAKTAKRPSRQTKKSAVAELSDNVVRRDENE